MEVLACLELRSRDAILVGQPESNISPRDRRRLSLVPYDELKFLDDLHHNAVHQFKDWRTAPATPMPTVVDTGTVVVDKSNLKVYREALAAHPEPM